MDAWAKSGTVRKRLSTAWHNTVRRLVAGLRRSKNSGSDPPFCQWFVTEIVTVSNLEPSEKKPNISKWLLSFLLPSRGARIRTGDLLLPKLRPTLLDKPS